jgi:uncharacterized coiled-coil protein SlyX
MTVSDIPFSSPELDKFNQGVMMQAETVALILVAALVLALVIAPFARKRKENGHFFEKFRFAEAQLEKSNEEIESLRKELDSLQKKHAALAKRLAQCEGDKEDSKPPSEEPNLVDNGTPSLQKEAITSAVTNEQIAPPTIVTRTSNTGATKAVDSWEQEREWTSAETSSLMKLFEARLDVKTLAMRMNMDAKDIVYRIARVAFQCEGDLEDLSLAPNHGRSWLSRDKEKLKTGIEQGKSIKEIGFALGRTQLAIVWQAIDRGISRP